MNKLIKYIMCLSVVMAFSSCEKLLDVNEDPNNITETSLTLASLLPTTQEAASRTSYSLASTASKVTHQVDNVSGEYYGDFNMGGPWSLIYGKGLNNLEQLITLADEKSSPAYSGIAKILQAFNVGLLADTWENAPYSEALDLNNSTPAYDTQEELYNTLQNLLSDGLKDLDAVSLETPGSDDLIYGGDIEKWQKLGHALRARYMIHLSNKSTVSWTNIMTEAGLGFAGNDDDFQLTYNATNKNPLHTGVALSNATGNVSIAQAEYVTDLLNGVYYPVIDPRLPIICDKGAAADYIGVASYKPETQMTYTCDFTLTTWHSTESAPVVMMSFAELKFIMAEAALMNGDMDAAYNAYMAGIAANMDKLGVDIDAATAYMADASVDVGMANLSLEQIMKEKYIANFFHVETWTDMRRHDFSTSIYKEFFEPIDPHFDNDMPAQRATYPDTEESLNPENATKNAKDIEAKMWRDQS